MKCEGDISAVSDMRAEVSSGGSPFRFIGHSTDSRKIVADGGFAHSKLNSVAALANAYRAGLSSDNRSPYGLQIFDTEALQVLFRCRDAAVAQDP
jgi:hypothetical protein